MTIRKVDERIRTLIQNGIRSKHRSMFVIIGDKSFDQIVNLHYLLRQGSDGKSSTNFKVLWCYRDKLELSSNKKKQAKQVKALVSKGLLDRDKAGTFSLFLETARIEYCRYKDSDRILGNTYAMCILQDFEALTPNLLARTLETVEGGGLIVLLLRTLRSLTSLYTMVMDVHARFRTESHPWEATGRFNERFILSLASCASCIFMDDELNILPISSHIKSVMPVPIQEDLPEAKCKLEGLKEELKNCFPSGPLMKMCCTLDQGKAVMNFLDVILDKTLCHTVALLAGRGRGKSAALGLAIAGAVAAGYSNIFVTAPSPENLKTLFQFVSKGFDMLNYKEHLDYDIVRSSDSELKNVVNRINIYKQHRQTIQYIQPHEHGKLSQVELLVVDEAAAIPLPVVKSLIGPYLVFLSSTVNGYEGTGRSLSLKLLQPLEQQSETSTDTSDVRSVRRFSKIELSEAIRYAPGDPVESWLNNLLCLDIKNSIPEIKRLPLPSECNLYYVNRDTLFSYHESTELFLQSMMALFAASHYKNSPNDLQLLADAPAHQLFVLLGPFNKLKDPDILCVIQVCLEGNISKASVMRSLSAGHQPSGDQIPWKFCEQFQDTNFASLSGARIVRIATHPDAMRQGYGSVAIELLARYFKGQFVKTNSSKSEADVMNVPKSVPLKITEAAKQASLLEENIKPRSGLPLLFERVDIRQQPEKLHYLGVSFGLTLDLFRFWGKHKFLPFYICEVPNSVTGEHTCMMLKTLDTDDIEVNSSDDLGFFGPFYRAFRSSFTRLLCSPSFNTMDYKLAMSILHPKLDFTDSKSTSTIAHGGIYDDIVKSPISMRKLEAYVNSLGHHHLISDLKLPLAYLYFQEKLPVNLSRVQASVLLCMGLQNQDLSYVEGVMSLEKRLILSYFMKVMKKFYKYLDSVTTQQFSATLPPVKKAFLRPHSVSVDEDLAEAAKKVKDDFKVKSGALLNPEPSHRYAISNEDVDFENALKNGSGSLPSGGIVSVKSNKTKSEILDRSDGKTKKKRKVSLMD